jgi:membrane carboxypeptidase/penicillin-binding protein
MYESFGGNIPARIWARYMSAALATTPKHDFTIPTDEVARMSCPGGVDYYLIANATNCHTLALHASYRSTATAVPATTDSPVPTIAPQPSTAPLPSETP